MKNNQKTLWIVFAVLVVIIIIITGITYSHSNSNEGIIENGSGTSTTADTGTGASSNANVETTNSTDHTSHTVSNAKAPIIVSLTPSVGKTNFQIQISGSGFTPTNNTVTFSGTVIGKQIISHDGSHLSFTIPQNMIAPGAYIVSVTNANGRSNLVNYSIVSN